PPRGWRAPLGRAAALITGAAPLPSLAELAGVLSRQGADQLDRVFLWVPVAFGLGAAAYLGLKAEPSVWSAVGLAAFFCAIAISVRLTTASRAAIALTGLAATAACGFLIAKLHSDRVAAPVVPTHLGVVNVEGWVVDIGNPSERGERLLIAPVDIARLAPAATPTRVRVVVAAPGGPESAPPPGTAIRVMTLLDPPPGPAAPGAYDFARDAWFEGIGGVGLAMRAPVLVALDPPPWRLRLEMAVNALRWTVARRLAANIAAVMGPDDGGAAGLAVAVTTSHQDWLAPAHRDDLRASGLAHMLAIAGLHTAALRGFAFFAFRFAIAAWPWLALRVPGKKIAAAAALLVVGAYLVLSGAHPPARRAAITASVAFFAILVDRRAVSLHSLSLAALIILLTEPEVVVSPGFEMSFCATASLVALAELWRHAPAPVGLAWPLALVQKARDWTIAMAMVSFVAGSATGPFAIQHFNRVANYGVFANLTADFVATAMLMPALALSLVAQAAGLTHATAGPVFWLAGWAARGVIFLGHVFATAPGASLTMASAPQVALAVSYLGILFACLWKGSLRWIGAPMAAAVALWPRPAAPVAWIAADGDDAAIVVGRREIALKPGKRLYATQLWAQRRVLALTADPAAAEVLQREYFDCDRKGCAPLGPTRPALAAWWFKRGPSPERAERLCAATDILVFRAATPAPPCQGAMVLTRADFDAGGAAEVFAAPGGWRIVWSQPLRGDRPWTRGGGS
ncbi:MAG: ComEC/Rec2 family competence protein, partial [Caulobacteraceae bacterium]